MSDTQNPAVEAPVDTVQLIQRLRTELEMDSLSKPFCLLIEGLVKDLVPHVKPGGFTPWWQGKTSTLNFDFKVKDETGRSKAQLDVWFRALTPSEVLRYKATALPVLDVMRVQQALRLTLPMALPKRLEILGNEIHSSLQAYNIEQEHGQTLPQDAHPRLATIGHCVDATYLLGTLLVFMRCKYLC